MYNYFDAQKPCDKITGKLNISYNIQFFYTYIKSIGVFIAVSL